MSRRLAALVAAALIVGAMLPSGLQAADPGKVKVSKADRAAIEQGKAQGKSKVRVLLAAQPGRTAELARAVEALGGTIEFREDAVNYVRASVPAAKADAVSALAAVRGFEVDRTIPLPDVRPGPDGVQPLVPSAPPSAATPRANPYMPIQDTGVAQWLAAHPTWDGRGVTIGIVDLGVSLDHPSLTTTSTGERKVIDWVTGTDPETDGDPTWLEMSAVADASSGSFTFDGVTWTAPAGTYRINVFRESNPAFGGEFSVAGTSGGDLNRDGDETDVFGVLWDPATNEVRVDTDLDRSFGDETAMTDYRVRFDQGWIGTDNPATPIAERVPFTVETNAELGYVNLGIVSGFHGSHVAGIAAGNALFGGQMSGAAPGAKIVSSRACLFVAGCTNHALLEGMIYVARDAGVDVINMSIGGLPALNDGNNTRCAVYDSLIETYGVQMFLSIGNSGPGVNTAGDPGLCGDVMGMAAYLTDDTMLADYGQVVHYQDNLHTFSSRGPREDGGFKPSAAAPGAAVSTTPLWQPGVGLPYVLPPGYQLANGTSMAAPQSTGLAAVLIGAGKATGVSTAPAALRHSLLSTARYLTEGNRFQAYDQGAGLLDVNAAWELLKKKPKTADITSSVEVNTVLDGFLATPGVGQGIYDREGVSLGDRYTRTYTFLNNALGTGTTVYNARWIGNDGTFSSPSTISIKNRKPQAFTVSIDADAYGAHSAILALDDPKNPGIEYMTMNTVIVPYEFAGPSFAQTVSGTIDIAQTDHLFFRVPSGTPALKVDLAGGGTAAGAGQIRFLRWSPWGLGIDSNAVSNCYNPSQAGCTTGDPLSRTAQDPIPGVWEVSVDARRTSDADDAPYAITASILGASVSPDPDVIASAAVGTPVSRQYTLTNLFGAFTGRAVGTNLGSAKIDRPTIADAATQTYTVAVPAGATSLRATIGNPADPAADLDLFVLNPAGAVAGQSADGDSEESVTIANPAAGTWTVVVDGFEVPAGSTAYDYIDVWFAGSSLGSIAVTDANALRPVGATWTVPAAVTALAVPAPGRVLYGNVEVRTDANILIGRGDVIVQSVTP
jgi:Subtilase family/Bacterial pre-peptidase C-terminal domain